MGYNPVMDAAPRFSFSAGALCLDYANTWGDRPDATGDKLVDYRALVAWTHQARLIAEAESASLAGDARRKPHEGRYPRPGRPSAWQGRRRSGPTAQPGSPTLRGRSERAARTQPRATPVSSPRGSAIPGGPANPCDKRVYTAP